MADNDDAIMEVTADLIGTLVDVDELADRLGWPGEAAELIETIETTDPDDLKMMFFILILKHAHARHPERFDLDTGTDR